MKIMAHGVVWLLIIVLYAPVFFQLYRGQWKANDYTHAYFILPIFFWLVWRKRGILRNLHITKASGNSIAGFATLAIGLGMFAFGWHYRFTFLVSLSLIPVLYGTISCLYGREILHVLTFPTLYLALIPPVPVGIIDNATLPLRFGVSIATEVILKFFHYPVGREGLLLFIGENELFMGQPCSGFRTIISLFSLMLVYVYVTRGSLLKKLILGFSIIPLSIVSNLIRVIAICLITYYFGEDAGQGFFHGFSGILLFVITIVWLLGLEHLLEKHMKQPDRGNTTVIHTTPRKPYNDEQTSVVSHTIREGQLFPPFSEYIIKGKKQSREWVAIALLLFTITYSFTTRRAKYAGIDTLPMLQIPFTIHEWEGKATGQEWNLGEDKYHFISNILEREYLNTNSENLYLIILDAGNFHNPTVCASSSGFTVRELNSVCFPLLNRTLTANCLYLEGSKENYLMLYWLCIDKNVVNWTGQKIKELWYSLLNKKKSGLMIRLDVPCSNDGIEKALLLAKEFVDNLFSATPPGQLDYIFGKAK
ncbi:MAG: exosortase C-terminal domain/associated protein EpsI [Candidatus Loosdrechtia sp.]|uniref:exosortase C-terminal domain/associated protein EpsI n=1 Tax=Candidatus Loosdrechtia sp. TaxID=3101272 RepID=UPI003A6B38AB|nr:MAG: EpsI family protein [Candidatus Jettenia sp. AMX2]